MTIKTIGDLAEIHSDTPLITDGQSALDLTATVYYGQGITKMVINKEAVSEDFFKLSTGLIGEDAQKFVNYHFSVAIFGNFSAYKSKPLRDYIYECNKGTHLHFAADEEEAIRMMGGNSHAESNK